MWQCNGRFQVKCFMGYTNCHVEEETLIKACLMDRITDGESRVFHGMMARTVTEREFVGRLLSEDFDVNRLHAENTKLNQYV